MNISKLKDLLHLIQEQAAGAIKHAQGRVNKQMAITDAAEKLCCQVNEVLEDIEENPRYIVLAGTTTEGKRVFGPFKTKEEEEGWSEKERLDALPLSLRFYEILPILPS
ncbi:hypothetical protein LCGC14_2628410 [marine sediment metagenome]|uniref:Uncharacterized protein n=1 Tax=marine sediment metagenome TaxID=412755 RepID=A0A0F9CTJ8_9ZZZZ